MYRLCRGAAITPGVQEECIIQYAACTSSEKGCAQPDPVTGKRIKTATREVIPVTPSCLRHFSVSVLMVRPPLQNNSIARHSTSKLQGGEFEVQRAAGESRKEDVMLRMGFGDDVFCC